MYVLSYRPDRREGEGKYHAVKVKVGRSGVKILARPGYFERVNFRRRTALERSLSAADVIANEVPFGEIPPRVLAAPFGPGRVRFVTHYGIDRTHVEEAVARIRSAMSIAV